VLLTQVFFKTPFYGILWGCTHVLCGSPTQSNKRKNAKRTPHAHDVGDAAAVKAGAGHKQGRL